MSRTPARKSVNKSVVSEVKGGKVEELRPVVNQVVEDRPEVNLKWEDYRLDFVARVKIHNYEFGKFVEDLKKAYDFLSPYAVKTYESVVPYVQGAWTFTVERYQELQQADSESESSEVKAV